MVSGGGVPVRVYAATCSPVWELPAVQQRVEQVKAYLESRGQVWAGLSLEQRRRALWALQRSCRLCPLQAETEGRPIPAALPEQPRAWVMGRNPGPVEQQEGTPFAQGSEVGRLLDRYLAALGLTRAECVLTDVVHCGTWRNRAPEQAEVRGCLHWQPLELAATPLPRLVLLLGYDALQAWFDYRAEGIGSVVGDLYWVTYQGEGHLLVPLYHPGHVLRDRAKLKDVATVLRTVRQLNWEGPGELQATGERDPAGSDSQTQGDSI